MNYSELLYYVVKYSKNPQIIKTYIKSAKHLGYDDSFLKMFGPDGNVLKEHILNLDRILRKLSIKYENDNQMLFNKLTKIFYTKKNDILQNSYCRHRVYYSTATWTFYCNRKAGGCKNSYRRRNR